MVGTARFAGRALHGMLARCYSARQDVEAIRSGIDPSHTGAAGERHVLSHGQK